MTTPTQITLVRPDDWHLHLRDGAAMASVVPATARQFARAIVMPNLRPPVTTAAMAVAYRDRIRAAVPEANPGVYVALALGVTFPFNLLVGIPLAYSFIQKLW